MLIHLKQMSRKWFQYNFSPNFSTANIFKKSGIISGNVDGIRVEAANKTPGT